MLKRVYALIKGDRMLLNSVILMSDALLLSLFGFLFWKLISMFMSPSQVGVGTTLISSILSLSYFSILGLNQALVRYLPQASDKARVINSMLMLVLSVSGIFGILFVLYLGLTKKGILVGPGDNVLFIAFLLLTTFYQFYDAVFIALRKPLYKLLKNLGYNISKIAVIFLILPFGAMGILYSQGAAALAATLIVLIILRALSLRLELNFDKDLILKYWRFSSANFISGLFRQLPAFVLPILVLLASSAENAAYYNLAVMIAAVLQIIPMEISTSVFAEASTNLKNHRKDFRRAFLYFIALIVPSSVAICLLSPIILGFFGSEYAKAGSLLLMLVVISQIPKGANTLFYILFNVKENLQKIVEINLLSAITLVLLGYYLLGRYGIVGLGVAHLIAPTMITLYFLFDKTVRHTLFSK